MKAIQMNKYGHNEVLRFNKNTIKPTIYPGHVIVEVFAAGVNPIDWKAREGHLQNLLKLQFPATLGMDFSGIIIDVGEGVTNFKKGDEVYGVSGFYQDGFGSFAEYVLVDTKNIALKPQKIAQIEAAALPLAGVSAIQGLINVINLSEGKKILIHGGSGGVGAMAIQLAKYLGAYVATTVSGHKKEFVKMLGADEVIDYENQHFEDLLHDYDAVLDTVGGETYIKSFKVVKNGGVIVSLLDAPCQVAQKEYQILEDKIRAKLSDRKIKTIFMSTDVTSERLCELAQFVDQGIIKVHIDKIFPLKSTLEALSYQQYGHPMGKVVVEVRYEETSKIKQKFINPVKERDHTLHQR